jgi:hypothetical protein
MNSTREDPEKPDSMSLDHPEYLLRLIDIIAGAIEMLEEQNSVLSQIVYNIL